MENAPVTGASTGLAGMRERVDLLGGTLTIDSIAGEGTTIHAEFSIPRATEMEVAQRSAHDDDESAEERVRRSVRDELRDRVRHQWRDAKRDAQRDTQRDALRDMTQDAARDALYDQEREEGKP
jgi:hypothetical protein